MLLLCNVQRAACAVLYPGQEASWWSALTQDEGAIRPHRCKCVHAQHQGMCVRSNWLLAAHSSLMTFDQSLDCIDCSAVPWSRASSAPKPPHQLTPPPTPERCTTHKCTLCLIIGFKVCTSRSRRQTVSNSLHKAEDANQVVVVDLPH